jgi:hypothetical protein
VKEGLMKLFVVVTAQKGPRQGTWNGVVTVPPDATSDEVYAYVMGSVIPEDLRGGTTLFYIAEPFRRVPDGHVGR